MQINSPGHAVQWKTVITLKTMNLCYSIYYRNTPECVWHDVLEKHEGGLTVPIKKTDPKYFEKVFLTVQLIHLFDELIAKSGFSDVDLLLSDRSSKGVCVSLSDLR